MGQSDVTCTLIDFLGGEGIRFSLISPKNLNGMNLTSFQAAGFQADTDAEPCKHADIAGALEDRGWWGGGGWCEKILACSWAQLENICQLH